MVRLLTLRRDLRPVPVLVARLLDASFHGEIALKNPSCVSRPAVGGGGKRRCIRLLLHMSVFVLLSLQEPADTTCVSHSLLLDDKDSDHRGGYARRPQQTRGRGRVCTVSLAVTLAGMLPLHLQTVVCCPPVVVSSGDRRKMSYPPPACSIMLHYIVTWP